MKKSNIVSASALFLGIILAVATSAFKAANVSQSRDTYSYGRLADGTWVQIDDLNYECDLSQNICKGTFSYPDPAQNAVPDVSIDQDNATYTPR